MRKLLFLATVAYTVISAQAAVLFYTDFKTAPAGFKAMSDSATKLNGDVVLVSNPAGATAPHDTTMDECVLSVPKSSTTITSIVISKGTQSFVKVGDTVGCTAGRISLKNMGASIKLPSVTGPCTITYYAAGSSAAAGKGVSCLINDVQVSEAGIPELSLNSAQATRKLIYPCPTAGPVVFTLSAIGSIYLYDIKIESGAVVNVKPMSVAKDVQTIQKIGNIIKNDKNSNIDVFTILGTKIFSSNKSTIDLSGLTSGVYMARVAGTHENIKIMK